MNEYHQVNGVPFPGQPTDGAGAPTVPGQAPDVARQLLALAQHFTIAPDVLPLEMGVFNLTVGGRNILLVIIMTPVGPSYYFMEAQAAIEFAGKLRQAAKQSLTGLVLPAHLDN